MSPETPIFLKLPVNHVKVILHPADDGLQEVLLYLLFEDIVQGFVLIDPVFVADFFHQEQIPQSLKLPSHI